MLFRVRFGNFRLIHGVHQLLDLFRLHRHTHQRANFQIAQHMTVRSRRRMDMSLPIIRRARCRQMRWLRAPDNERAGFHREEEAGARWSR